MPPTSFSLLFHLRVTLLLALAAQFLGLALVEVVQANPLWYDPSRPGFASFYFYTFSHDEGGSFLSLSLVLATIFAGSFGLRDSGKNPTSLPSRLAGFLETVPLTLPITLAVLFFTCWGRFALDQNFDLCVDEALNQFQVEILNHGRLVAPVPPEWQSFVDALRMPSLIYNASGHYWGSIFLPGFAFLDFILWKIGLDWAISPLFAAGSLLLLGALMRRLYPDRAVLASNIAVLLLAASPQFLGFGIAKYAWEGHLCTTLLWLWLYTHPRLFWFSLTPVLGAFLIGFHQPHVHPLIALPFVFRLIVERRWRAFLWFSVWYGMGAVLWYQEFALLRAVPWASENGGVRLSETAGSVSMAYDFLSKLSFNTLIAAIYLGFDLLTTLSWSTPLLIPLFFMWRWSGKHQPVLLLDAVIAVLITTFFYLIWPYNQGNGWGYRYIHSVYALFALVGAGSALRIMRSPRGRPVGATLILAGFAFSLLIQIPYRSCEIRSLVTPMARTAAYLESRPVDFVLINSDDFWYACDLVRNDPWLQRRPLILNEKLLSPEQVTHLYQRGTVQRVGPEEVRKFGVFIADPKRFPPGK